LSGIKEDISSEDSDSEEWWDLEEGANDIDSGDE